MPFSGTITSCGYKNEENKANIRAIDNGLVDGTKISAISKSRKINKNNTSGYIGVSYSKEKKKWVAQIIFKERIILLEDLTQNVKLFKLGKNLLFDNDVKKIGLYEYNIFKDY